MTYAIIYQSESGNTRKIAETIYDSIQAKEKQLISLNESREVPRADVYLIGGGVHDGTLSLDLLDCLDEIEGGKIALFLTCGFLPTDQYKERLEKAMAVWLPDEAQYLGMFLCQGAVGEVQQKRMREKMPEVAQKLVRMFEMGNGHPDEEDMEKAREFARCIEKL